MSLAAGADEYLENGASVRSPDGDNLILDSARTIFAAYAAIAQARGGRSEIAVSPIPYLNVCVALDALVPADRAAAAATGFHASREGPFVFFSAWPYDDLAPHGFHRIGYPPFMFRPPGLAPAAPAGVRIHEVDAPEAARAWERAIAAGYPMPEAAAPGSALPDVFPVDRWHFFVAYDGDRAVGTSAAFVTDHAVEVEMISVHPDGRGMGLGRALTAAAVDTAPDRPAVLISSDDGYSVYRRLGFIPLTRFGLWLGGAAQG
jgi:GNAT superfamily N-acetyltransferase